MDPALYIEEGHLPYEEALARDPTDAEKWLQYYLSREPNALFEAKVFVLLRAVHYLPRAQKLWDIYTDLVLGEESSKNASVTSETVTALFQIALRLLPGSVSLWRKYLGFLVEKRPLGITEIRRSFNTALRSLNLTEHSHIWPLYLQFADEVGGPTASLVYQKYLQYATPESLRGLDKEGLTIDVIAAKFVQFGDFKASAAQFDGILTSPELYASLPKSLLQLWLEYTDMIAETFKNDASDEVDEFLEKLVLKGICKFPDQMGNFYAKIAKYFAGRGAIAKSRHYLEKGIKDCVTIRDFALIFDTYTDIEEGQVNDISARLEDEPSNMLLNAELEFRLNFLENFLDKRPVYLNDMMLRQDPNSLDEWVKKIEIHEKRGQLEMALTTYATALTNINPLKCHSLDRKSTLASLWIRYSKIYSTKNDLNTANLIFSKAVKSQFKSPDDLADIYIAWSELLLEIGKEDESTTLVRDVLFTAPSDIFVDYNDSKVPVQGRIHKSLKLWSFYLDLLESMIDEDDECDDIVQVTTAYDKMIALKIASPLTITNYASFLQRHKYWERSFLTYEVGLRAFKSFKVKFEIWNVYLSKILQYNKETGSITLERIRDLFESATEESQHVGDKQQDISVSLVQSIFLLYSKFEEEKGSVTKSIKILHQLVDWIRAAFSIPNLSKSEKEALNLTKVDTYLAIVFKITALLNDTNETRITYEKALNDDQLKTSSLIKIAKNFIDFETGLGQSARVRSLFKFITKLAAPHNPDMLAVWSSWEQFELNNGDEFTFKDMLRHKRAIKSEFENEQVIKESINPLGFVKANTPANNGTTANASISNDQSNPDAIDLDMDM